MPRSFLNYDDNHKALRLCQWYTSNIHFMNDPSNTLFHEVQPLRMWWVWLLLLIPIVLGWWLFIEQIILGIPVGTNPASNVDAVIIWLAFGIGLPLFFYSTKLLTDVRKDGVYLRFFPLWSRTVPLTDIVTYEARQYRPLREYGGWGIRFGPHRKRAYNVSGNRGVEVKLTDGTQLLIGSQRPEELASAISVAKASR